MGKVGVILPPLLRTERAVAHAEAEIAGDGHARNQRPRVHGKALEEALGDEVLAGESGGVEEGGAGESKQHVHDGVGAEIVGVAGADILGGNLFGVDGSRKRQRLLLVAVAPVVSKPEPVAGGQVVIEPDAVVFTRKGLRIGVERVEAGKAGAYRLGNDRRGEGLDGRAKPLSGNLVARKGIAQ